MQLKDADRFYEILMPMLDWAKESKDVKAMLDTDHADKDKERSYNEKVYKQLNIVWKHPELIDQYIAEKGTALSAQTKQVLADWQKNCVPGPFFVERFTLTGAIFISAANGNVYRVQGITNDIRDIIPVYQLPCLVYTTLIPYNRCIVYDSSIQLVQGFLDELNKDAPQLIHQIYETAKRFNNIIARLPARHDLITDKQQALMQEVMMPVIFKTSKTADIDEISRQAYENPNVHPIQPKDLSVLEKLLEKDFRNEEEWDRIRDILLSGDVFSATPIGRPKSVTEVEGILCHKGDLFVFTTLEKCRDFINQLHKMDDSIHYMNFASLPYEDALDIANETHRKLVIDFPISDISKKCLVYDSDQQRISATIVLRH